MKRRYQILSISIRDLIACDFDLHWTQEQEAPYLIEQGESLFTGQLRRICGSSFIRRGQIEFIPQMILVQAKKAARKNHHTRELLRVGFTYNGVHFVRYGKSNSQAKEGITLFLDEAVYPQMLEASQLGITVDECVISKYESQRCLTLSTCTLIRAPLPHIVIVDEYTKGLPDQQIRYVVEEPITITDRETGEEKRIKTRRVNEGRRDISLSPFDGCGCHDERLSRLWSKQIGLDYDAIGFQIRLPFLKGYSVEMPFREYYRSVGITEITDIFGAKHRVEDIDCIWNISMWKGYKLFKEKYGAEGWRAYLAALEQYGYQLGISKYSHHKKDCNLWTRLNFQYIQCLDLWNKPYMDWFDKQTQARKDGNGRVPYDTLDEANWGNLLRLASRTTDLYERIIKGDKLYTLKFLGIEDTADGEGNGQYIQAALLNDAMLRDPCIKQFLCRKLKKAILQAHYGKIYAEGFYHTVVGDMIGYLQFAAGLVPAGCLQTGEFYCDTIPKGRALSFRSPLVCPSEVNEVQITGNELTDKWLSHFKDQDVVMLNMYDLSLPQQGGMDCDGDAVFLCCDPLLVNTKLHKPIIIDVEDKAMTQTRAYTPENIVEYEMNSRDNRIGEITNVATSILNQYTKDEKWQKIHADNVSLLRIFQGKEIDYLKTGLRWTMNKGLRRYAKKLPYFLLYNYPDKLKRYRRIRQRNAQAEHDNRLPLNAYHSPSPLNELCDYVETWEKKRVLWDKSCLDTRCLIVDGRLDLSDKCLRRSIRHLLNEFANEWRRFASEQNEHRSVSAQLDAVCAKYADAFAELIADKTLRANYVIDVAYASSGNKTLAWRLYGNTILENLRRNSPLAARTRIVEVPYKTEHSAMYLGKYYEMIGGVLDE